MSHLDPRQHEKTNVVHQPVQRVRSLRRAPFQRAIPTSQIGHRRLPSQSREDLAVPIVNQVLQIGPHQAGRAQIMIGLEECGEGLRLQGSIAEGEIGPLADRGAAQRTQETGDPNLNELGQHRDQPTPIMTMVVQLHGLAAIRAIGLRHDLSICFGGDILFRSPGGGIASLHPRSMHSEASPVETLVHTATPHSASQPA